MPLTSCASCLGVTRGFPNRVATRGSLTTRAATLSASDQGSRRSWSRASSKAARAQGRAMVSRSAMVRVSDLGRELLEQVGVRACVDLAPEELGGRAHRDARHLTAQGFARPGGIELDLLVRGGDQARAFAARRALGLLHQIAGAVLRLVDDLVGALARLAHDGVGLAARRGELLLALLGGRESLRDLARALLHRVQDVRPDVLHRAEDQQGEHEHLHDQREIDVHGPFSPPLEPPAGARQCAARSASTKGFANVKNSAKPMPIIATASSRPATRNICMRSTGSSSGWRAEPSMKRPPRMPKPMAVPRAPMPKMMPTASTVMASMCAMFSMQLSSKTNTQTFTASPTPLSVMLVSHRQIDDRQHHEYEGLDRDDQDMERRPHQSEGKLGDESEPTADRGESAEPA